MTPLIQITCLYLITPILILSLVFTTISFVRHYNLLDRVVALDMFIAIAAAFIIMFSILYKEKHLVDVIIVLSILTFLGTVAFAYYYQKHQS